MNAIWTKQDIDAIIAEFEDSDMVHHKGITFLKICPGSEDLLTQYMEPICRQSGGACATGMIRSIIASSYEHTPCDGSKFILDHTEENGMLLPMISIDSGLFNPKHADRIGFVIAHEIGHVVNGDIMVGNETIPGSPENLANEIKADQFAIGVMGSRLGALSTLGLMCEHLLKDDGSSGGIPPEVHGAVLAFIKARLDWIE